MSRPRLSGGMAALLAYPSFIGAKVVVQEPYCVQPMLPCSVAGRRYLEEAVSGGGMSRAKNMIR